MLLTFSSWTSVGVGSDSLGWTAAFYNFSPSCFSVNYLWTACWLSVTLRGAFFFLLHFNVQLISTGTGLCTSMLLIILIVNEPYSYLLILSDRPISALYSTNHIHPFTFFFLSHTIHILLTQPGNLLQLPAQGPLQHTDWRNRGLSVWLATRSTPWPTAALMLTHTWTSGTTWELTLSQTGAVILPDKRRNFWRRCSSSCCLADWQLSEVK